MNNPLDPLPKVTGKATVSLNGSTFQFDVASVKLGVTDTDEGDVIFSGTDGSIYSSNMMQSTSFSVPLENVSPELLSVITGQSTKPASVTTHERVVTHPDGSQSWVEVQTLAGSFRKMRTVYASEWSDYMEAPDE